MSDKELMNEELTRIIGGVGMSAAKFQSTCATLSSSRYLPLSMTRLWRIGSRRR